VIRAFGLAFIPLFVAMDVVGLLPVYLGLATGMSELERRRVALEATLTAAGVGVGFLVLGDMILHVLGISSGDFQVAGGLLLLVISVHDLLHPDRPLREVSARIGVVPLGTPLIVGPAVLATLLALGRSAGYPATILAFVLNLVIVSVALRWASTIERAVTEAGARAVAKVASLLLAAIAVAMIRTGMTGALTDLRP
jgi:multiple antibiotic resistance protein